MVSGVNSCLPGRADLNAVQSHHLRRSALIRDRLPTRTHPIATSGSTNLKNEGRRHA